MTCRRDAQLIQFFLHIALNGLCLREAAFIEQGK